MARNINGSGIFIPYLGSGVVPSNLNITTQVSWGGWIYVTSAPASGNQQTIYGNGTGVGSRNLAIDYRNITGTLQLEASWGVAGNFAEARGVQTLTLNTWYHIGFTCDLTLNPYVPQFYVNGVAITTTNSGTATTGTPTTNNTELQLGALPAGGGIHWVGNLADIAVWKGVLLTAAEMTALARGIRAWMIRKSSLVGYWPLQGTQPEIDLSGSGVNNATGTSGYSDHDGDQLSTLLATTAPPLQPLIPRWTTFVPGPAAPAVLAAATGFFTLTGKAASALKASKLTTNAGFYTLTGKNGALVAPTKASIRAKGFLLGMGPFAGTAVAQGPEFRGLTGATGSYNLTGKAVTLTATRKLLLGTGAYLITGKDVTMIRATGFVPPARSALFGISAQPSLFGGSTSPLLQGLIK